ncbi:DUF397 domain-containing protein [Micromonospora sp. 4G55]|uniref:DUF397 domain-containing protein n=1 Tax=Micromonospora sp. 4G55 TaxID=2806102 RepID=UPI001A578F87|nr:DUF397 domain-containing protein [Micromonospora sp. 4G55]
MDLSRAVWRKSTRSGSSGNCVEVATPPQVIMVRDSKDQHGAVLSFTAGQWDGFIKGIKAGELERESRLLRDQPRTGCGRLNLPSVV